MTAEMKPEAAIATRLSPGPAKASNDFTLLVLTGLASGQAMLVDKKIRIGKAPDNDLILPDDTVSRHHCDVERRGDCIWVKDLGSTNGTRIAGSKITEALAPPGSVLRFGEIEVVVRATPQKVDVLPSKDSKFGPAIGESLAMRTVFGMLERIAPTDGTVLLEGETGTGKDVLARAIHQASPRSKEPFVVLDCGAISYSLIESELFGHERGAFTGAIASRRGAFENAEGGTLFLDEVGELPIDIQPKLLRVLESREFRRVGGNKTLRADVRVVAATKRDLKREVERGKFREDLYFRLAVVPIVVPSLRTRREDIRGLVHLFLEQSSQNDATLGALSMADEAISALTAHDWPGNVRELRNVLERAVYLARAAGESEVKLITLPASADRTNEFYAFQAGRSYRDTRTRFESEFERRYVKWLLGRHNGNISAAAREAQMDRKYLYDLAKKHGMRGKDDESSE
ncbi:MAG TPA: sigma 54-interacting transcriptional regulator [Polyangiaceae bacterium]|nr:sigma 54-interacting transcriptional regulator [Polyangiaceae bacterium]